MNPSVTIILPAYNAAATLADTLRSCLDQTYDNFEVWLLENGSTDNTLEIAAQFEHDARLKVFSLGKVGFQGALEYGLANTSSKYLARMDADDLCFRNRLERQVEFLENTEGAVMLGTHYVFMTPFGHLIERKPNSGTRKLGKEQYNTLDRPVRKFFADPTVMFNREAALEAGGYDKDFSLGDNTLWFRLLDVGECYEIDEPLLAYRLNPASMSTSKHAYTQNRMIREKYAPDQLSHWPEWEERKVIQGNKVNFWKRVADFEWLAGETSTKNKAIQKVFREKASLKLRAKIGINYLCRPGYKKVIAGRHKRAFIRRKDFESQYIDYLNTL